MNAPEMRKPANTEYTGKQDAAHNKNAFVIKWEFDQEVWGVALEFANGDQAADGLAQDQPGQPTAGEHSRHWAQHGDIGRWRFNQKSSRTGQRLNSVSQLKTVALHAPGHAFAERGADRSVSHARRAVCGRRWRERLVPVVAEAVKVLAKDRPVECRCLLSWAACVAFSRPISRELRKHGWTRTTFYRRVEDGAERIADYLNGRSVTVR